MEKLFYYTRTWDEFNYVHTEIVVFGAHDRTLVDRLAGTIDNKDGYWTQEAANYVASRTHHLIVLGYTNVIEFSAFHPRVRFVWQHYGQDYCAVRTEIGDQPAFIEKSLPVLRKVAKAARKFSPAPERTGKMTSLDLERPEYVLKAMHKLKITKVERIEGTLPYEYDNVYKAT